jgi:hypothetical protein
MTSQLRSLTHRPPIRHLHPPNIHHLPLPARPRVGASPPQSTLHHLRLGLGLGLGLPHTRHAPRPNRRPPPRPSPRIGLDIHLAQLPLNRNLLRPRTRRGLPGKALRAARRHLQRVDIYSASTSTARPSTSCTRPTKCRRKNGNRMGGGARWVAMRDGQGNWCPAPHARPVPPARARRTLTGRRRATRQRSWRGRAIRTSWLRRRTRCTGGWMSRGGGAWGRARVGPGVADKYQVKCRDVEFGFRLDPVGALESGTRYCVRG